MTKDKEQELYKEELDLFVRDVISGVEVENRWNGHAWILVAILNVLSDKISDTMKTLGAVVSSGERKQKQNDTKIIGVLNVNIFNLGSVGETKLTPLYNNALLYSIY